MNTQVFTARRDRLRTLMAGKGYKAMLVPLAANRYYLSGFELHDPQCNESAGMILVTDSGEDWLMTDSRFIDAAARVWPRERVFIYRYPVMESIGRHIRSLGYSEVCVDDQSLSFRNWKNMSNAISMVPCSGYVEALRLIKDDTEIAAIRKANALNHKVFAQIEKELVPGRTEREIAWMIEKLYREQGASELAFTTIVAVGKNAALPHAIPGDDIITENCPVLIDKGCRVDEYCSDQTRTFWVGNSPSDEFKRTLELVQEAQRAGISAIAGGEPIPEVYDRANSVFERHGVEKYFTHSFGHGVGLETHEGPGLSMRGTQLFEPGMVVTAEPGLYYPEWGGVRWEHMVLVTDDACEVL
ncbi:aminopeptidase P family protein [Desulfobaculum bizertense]|uniref:M24 family metallopeptidase n=1 Tax=Desulfobaculum bizertense TaxID=376490 RepID=UPI001F28B10F|nr:aminopeptidase P family protein [Desulfobaculum bizertense]UIJ37934.1 aminopeptidase P family protein [Desulfobaculum bizertense]